MPTRGLSSVVMIALAGILAACGAGTPDGRLLIGKAVVAAARVDPRPAPVQSFRGTRFAVGLRVITIVDPHRRVRIPGRGVVRRSLLTVVRYPAVGRPGRVDLAGATPARQAGRFPLVVFGHGFAVSPAIYAGLLQAWAAAGYVVAAPVFPLENANAPGGPNESDLVNQPADMSLVISRMLELSANMRSAFAGVIDPRAIAVAGQSDGGETALATAYYPQYIDRRVDAVVILSGAKIGPGSLTFPSGSPPLLATQGTADVINPPSQTAAFFDIAPPPKYLLTLVGASHLAPYTDQQPQLGIVERVTTAFLDGYVKHAGGATGRLRAAGDVPGTAVLRADP